MPDETYKGWRNYETWAVALWIDRTEPDHAYWTEVAEGILATAQDAPPLYDGETPRDRAGRWLADRLEEEHEAAAPLGKPTLYTDLLNSALSYVDWRELADHYIDTAREEQSYRS